MLKSGLITLLLLYNIIVFFLLLSIIVISEYVFSVTALSATSHLTQVQYMQYQQS